MELSYGLVKQYCVVGGVFAAGIVQHGPLSPDMPFPGNIKNMLDVFLRAPRSPIVSLRRQTGCPQVFEGSQLSLGLRNMLEGGFGGAPGGAPMGTSE